MVCRNCGKESMGNTQVCSGCGAALDAQQGQQLQQQGQQFPQQGQQFPQQGQQFPQQGQQFPQQGQQFPQQGQQFPQQGQQFPQQGQQFQQQGQQFPQQGMQGSPPGAPPKKGLSKKLMIIIGAAALVVIGVVVVLIFALGGSSYETDEFFDVGGDKVPSVMYVLGEKRKISEVIISSSKSADKIVVEYSVSENQGDEMEEYAGVLVDDFDFIALDEYDFSGKRGSDFQFVKVSDEDDDHIVIVTIDFNNSGYTLTIERREGELNVGSGDNGDADNGDVDNGDEPTANNPNIWPADILPPGFPVYPEGDFEDGSTDITIIFIHNTSINTFEEYKKELEAWGFEFEEPYSSNLYFGATSDWKIAYSFSENDNTACISLGPSDEYDWDTDNGDEPVDSYIEGWPTDGLPSGFPEYPGGKPSYKIDDPYVFISIEDTDKKTFEGYMADVKAWGFEFGEPDSDGVYTGFAENLQLVIVFHEDFNFLYIGLGPPAD